MVDPHRPPNDAGRDDDRGNSNSTTKAQLERYNDLKIKSLILGPQKKYKTGDDLREWFTSIQIGVQWLGLNEHEARMYIYSHIEDLAVKSSVE